MQRRAKPVDSVMSTVRLRHIKSMLYAHKADQTLCWASWSCYGTHICPVKFRIPANEPIGTIHAFCTSILISTTEMVWRKPFTLPTESWLSASTSTESSSQELANFAYVLLTDCFPRLILHLGYWRAQREKLRSEFSLEGWRIGWKLQVHLRTSMFWSVLVCRRGISKLYTGHPTSDGIIQSVSNSPAMWNRLLSWWQVGKPQPINARYCPMDPIYFVMLTQKC